MVAPEEVAIEAIPPGILLDPGDRVKNRSRTNNPGRGKKEDEEK